MFFIALKNLFQEKAKLLISIGGVAFSVMLIVLLNGLYQGWNESMGGYIKSVPADLWVEQDGVGDMFHALSFLPDNLSNSLQQVDGVTQVNPYLGRQTQFKVKDQDVSLFIVGFNPATGFGKPQRMHNGDWRTLHEGEIIVDEVFARENELALNDTIEISGQQLKIAGLSSGGNMMVFQYAFVTFAEAKELFNLGNKVNFYVLNTQTGKSTDQIQQEIKDTIPGVKVLTKQEFVDASQKMIKNSFLPIIYVLVVIGLCIGSAVIGLTIYSATIEKSREYGVMKAIGVNNMQLYRIVLFQSLISGCIGYIVGVIFAYPIASLAQKLVAGFLTEIRLFDLAWVFGATIGMSVIATYIPIKRLISIDPAEVFKN